jgi:hypothetical protein
MGKTNMRTCQEAHKSMIGYTVGSFIKDQVFYNRLVDLSIQIFDSIEFYFNRDNEDIESCGTILTRFSYHSELKGWVKRRKHGTDYHTVHTDMVKLTNCKEILWRGGWRKRNFLLSTVTDVFENEIQRGLHILTLKVKKEYVRLGAQSFKYAHKQGGL